MHMSQTTFAAIDVGSNEVSMKLYEVSKKNGIIELDHVRHTIELGADTYSTGKISHSLVDELCKVLTGFTKKMKEYDITDYNACATSAIREAQNQLFILDQIRLNSGLKVKILSNSEQRFLLLKAIARNETDFNSMIQTGTAIVDVGAGSIQISLFAQGNLITTQNIKLGSLRIREILSDFEYQTSDYNRLILEYIENDIQTFQNLFFQHLKIKHIVGIGENLTEFIRNSYEVFHQKTMLAQLKKSGTDHYETVFFDRISRNDFSEFYQTLLSTSIDVISHNLGIPRDQATLILPTAMIYYKLFEVTDAKFMWLPGSTLCDGIVADYAEKKEKIIPSHEFTLDIIGTARCIATRYHCNESHIRFVEKMSLLLFDQMKKLHGLGKRERLLLQIASILHSCGEFINLNSVAENSYNIIMSTEIIGLSHSEREMIANIAKYNAETFPVLTEETLTYEKDLYITLCKLTAILQIANALDKSHKQKFETVKITFKNHEMLIYAETLNDITLEHGLICKKAYFFEEVYGIKPVLKQKRSI